jgi:hypothetical protein
MLRRICALTVLAFALVAGPTAASEGKASAEKQVGQYVDLQPVALPVVVDGRLMNYVFLSVRLNLSANADTSRWRAKEPYFRDALVRVGHQTSFAVPNDRAKLDLPRLNAAMMRAAAGIAGAGVVRSVTITTQGAGPRARIPAT